MTFGCHQPQPNMVGNMVWCRKTTLVTNIFLKTAIMDSCTIFSDEVKQVIKSPPTNTVAFFNYCKYNTYSQSKIWSSVFFWQVKLLKRAIQTYSTFLSIIKQHFLLAFCKKKITGITTTLDSIQTHFSPDSRGIYGEKPQNKIVPFATQQIECLKKAVLLFQITVKH